MSNSKPAQQAQTDEWRPVRTHSVLRRFQRGPGKTKRFVGQQQDETLRRVVREHPIFYAWSALPLLLSLVFLGLVTSLEGTNALPDSVFPILYLISGILIIGSAIYGVYRMFELWWVNVTIVTNKRVLNWRGLPPIRDETSLDQVQQVAVDQSLLGTILSYGTVHVYLSGGKEIIIKNVPDPKGVRDDIEGIRQSYKAARSAKAPDTMATLDQLAKKEPLPQLPDADAKWAHQRSPDKVRGPLRRFGGPLRLKCDVHYDAEEYTVMYIQRAWQVLALRLIIPALALLGTLLGTFIAKVGFSLFAIAFFVILAITALMVVNYLDDVFILTTKRVIDINRQFVIFSKQHDTTSYEKISKIEVRSPNILWLAMDIGHLFIETQGNNPNITMRHIAHPFFIQDKMYEIKGFKEKLGKVKAKNERKAELNEWFSVAFTTREQKVISPVVPNLQSLDLGTAFARAIEVGMELMVIGESSKYPAIGAGKIAEQTPPPGAIVNLDPQNPQKKPQIQVLLSK